MYPLYAFVLRGNTLYANFYLSGEAETKLESGQKLKIICDNDYPASGKANLTVKLEKPEKFAVMLRAGGADIDMSGEYENGYYKIEKVWQDGEKITLDFRTELKEIHKRQDGVYVRRIHACPRRGERERRYYGRIYALARGRKSRIQNNRSARGRADQNIAHLQRQRNTSH